MGNVCKIVRFIKAGKSGKITEQNVGYAIPFGQGTDNLKVGYTGIMKLYPISDSSRLELYFKKAQDGELPTWDLNRVIKIADKDGNLAKEMPIGDSFFTVKAQSESIKGDGTVQQESVPLGSATFLKSDDKIIAEMKLSLDSLPLPTVDDSGAKLVFKVFAPRQVDERPE